jgi:hypothetical protein
MLVIVVLFSLCYDFGRLFKAHPQFFLRIRGRKLARFIRLANSRFNPTPAQNLSTPPVRDKATINLLNAYGLELGGLRKGSRS